MRNRIIWRVSVVCIALCCTMLSYAQSWTSEELRAANTAGSCSYLSQVEKDVILYNNLARMYPAKFASIELRGQRESGYLTSLRSELNSMSALPPLTVNRTSTSAARCWATESGQRGLTGHNRVGCDKYEAGHAWGENCSYGKSTGRDIILQLLIDEGISNLGHRRNCLSRNFRSVGVGYATHTGYRYCCVMDFTDEEGESYNASIRTNSDTQSTGGTVWNTQSSSIRETPSQPSRSQTSAQAPSRDLAPRTAPVATPATPVTTTTVTTTTAAPVTAPAPQEESTSSLLDRYFDHSGYHTLSYISVGYTYSFMNQHHLMTFSILDFRTTLLGISPLCTELSISPLDTRVAYKPSVRIYIPVAKFCAVVPYGGAAVDISGIGKIFSQNYDYQNARDFYASAIAGVAVNFSASKHVPAEIRVEYRHPIVTPTAGSLSPQGVYLGAQFYIGSTFNKK